MSWGLGSLIKTLNQLISAYHYGIYQLQQLNLIDIFFQAKKWIILHLTELIITKIADSQLQELHIKCSFITNFQFKSIVIKLIYRVYECLGLGGQGLHNLLAHLRKTSKNNAQIWSKICILLVVCANLSALIEQYVTFSNLTH